MHPLFRLAVVTSIALAVAATSAEPSSAASDQAVSEAVSKLEENQAQITAKQAEIDSIEKKINELTSKRNNTAAEAELIDSQLQRLGQELAKAQLELNQTRLTIEAVRQENQDTATRIEELGQEVNTKRQHLRTLIRQLYQHEQASLVRVFFSTGSLSTMLAQRAVYQELQARTINLVQDLRHQEEDLTAHQAELDQQEQDLSNLHELLESQQSDISRQEAQQSQFLQAKREQQAEYEHLITEAKQARQEIEQDIFTLKNVKIEVALQDIFDIARFASKLTGVRPALLLGVLKIESNLGESIGSGTFPDDMHPASREPFLRITKKLGLDPATAPISARPASYSGWGGAMGPAQIMPETWERIEARLASLMSKPAPNPYELLDAIVATAMFLADKGAADPAKEYEAVNRYLAGPNWQNFTWYGDRVLAVAKEYEKEGLK